MNWIPAVVGGLTGAVTALAFHLVLRITGRTEPKGWHRTTYIILFVTALTISRYTVTPWAEREYFAQTAEERLAEGNKVFAAVRKYEPQTYAVIVQRARAALRNGAPVEEMQAAIRAEFSPMIVKRIPRADDHAVHGYMKANMQELRELHAAGDEACYTFLFPGSGPSFDVSARVSHETLEADLDGAAAVIQSAATTPQPVPSFAEVQQLFAPAATVVATKYGAAAFDAMQRAQTSLSDKRRVCEITLSLYDELLRMQPEKGGRVIRALLSQ